LRGLTAIVINEDYYYYYYSRASEEEEDVEDRTPLKRSEWHVLTTDHTVYLLVTHTFIHEWNEPSCLYSSTAEHHCTLVGQAELAWLAGYLPRW